MHFTTLNATAKILQDLKNRETIAAEKSATIGDQQNDCVPNSEWGNSPLSKEPQILGR